jgi:two-component system sensor kinase FixL
MPFPKIISFNLSILQKIVLGFGLAALLLMLIAIITYGSTRSFITTAGEVAHSRQVLEVNETLLRHLTEAESGERGFLITGDSIYLLTYTSAWVLITQDLDNLKNLTADNAWQQERLARLQPLIWRKLTVVKENITTRQVGGSEKATKTFASGEDRELMADIREIIMEFGNGEQALLAARIDSFGHIGKVTTVVIIFGTLAGVLVLAAGTWMILRDVSARHQAEEALAGERNLLSTLIETIPYHVYVKDLEGRYLLDNASHRRYLGVAGMNEVKGKRSSDFFDAELASLYQEIDQEVMRNQEPLLNHEEPAVEREGNLVWHATSKVPLRDHSGKLVGLLCLSENITARKHAEEKLRHFALQMERSNKELQEFASIASHDLQEPLRKIMAFGHRLRTKCEDAIGAQGLDYLDRMMNAAQRMQNLIQDLLTLSRVSSDKRPFEEVNLAQIAREVISDLELRIEQTGAVIEIGWLPKIEANPLQMRQLIQNLLSNALKFQHADIRPVVSISAKIVEVNDYQIPGALPGAQVSQIMVKDNGIGFSEKYAEQIFALFQRLHGRLEYEGTGIGLAVCRKITDRHGGNIMAKSTEGQGATFIVTLPLKQNTNPIYD